jgi:hypothetical protein
VKRTLTLKREHLAELSSGELERINAAGETGPQPTPPVYAPRTLPVRDCLAGTLDSDVICPVYTYGTCAC